MAAKGNTKHESCPYMDCKKFNINLWEVDRDEEHHDPHHYLVAISDVALPPSKDFYTINISRDQARMLFNVTFTESHTSFCRSKK